MSSLLNVVIQSSVWSSCICLLSKDTCRSCHGRSEMTKSEARSEPSHSTSRKHHQLTHTHSSCKHTHDAGRQMTAHMQTIETFLTGHFIWVNRFYIRANITNTVFIPSCSYRWLSPWLYLSFSPTESCLNCPDSTLDVFSNSNQL